MSPIINADPRLFLRTPPPLPSSNHQDGQRLTSIKQNIRKQESSPLIKTLTAPSQMIKLVLQFPHSLEPQFVNLHAERAQGRDSGIYPRAAIFPVSKVFLDQPFGFVDVAHFSLYNALRARGQLWVVVASAFDAVHEGFGLGDEGREGVKGVFGRRARFFDSSADAEGEEDEGEEGKEEEEEGEDDGGEDEDEEEAEEDFVDVHDARELSGVTGNFSRW